MESGDWLARRAQLSPNKVALIDTLRDGRAISYREWNRSANRTANFLRERLGVEKGERVAVLAKNSVEYLDIWFALGKLGAILQNLNWRLTPSELSGLIEDAEPKVLVYGPEFVETVEALREQVKDVSYWVALDEKGLAHDGDILFAERARFPDGPRPWVEVAMDDPWVICYTGGTTGLPKGAILTHGNVFWNAVNTVVSWGLTPEDVTNLNAPLFHTGGLNVFTAPLVHIGGTSIVCREFDVDQVFDLIREYDVSVYFGVPTMFIAMQQHPRWEEADFSGLKLLISGGAPCPMPVFEKFWARGVDFKTGYGLTEAGPNTFWLPPEDVRRKPGAVGFPLFHIDVKAVDREGNECAPGEVGELLIRGPHVCAGYWNRPDATAEAIREGWLHTGDLARRDEEGYYTIVGRLKEMIISGGENIYPAEIESVLAAHDGVAEVAVIGVPHERWGEVGWAIVVPKDDALTEAELLDFAGDRLARYKVPKRVLFRDELPKTGAGKVDKKALERELS
ncbi:MAG: long-chain fatty acid--CoA ligase [Chloroflexota bacterium]|nr:long-chain fatty acid--CoA ligase [Chloroflexota bacterium]